MSMQPSNQVEKPGLFSKAIANKVLFADLSQTQFEMHIATEMPVNIVYGGLPYAVMMITPHDVEDFIYGFSLTEGIIKTPDDVRDVAISYTADSINVEIVLSSSQFQAHLAKRRTLTGRTSCGLCGLESSSDLPVAIRLEIEAEPVSYTAIENALGYLVEQQPLNAITHSVHAAAWCDKDGRIIAVREDVGRHNALDKLIGALIIRGVDPRYGFVLITSRASFEMIEKSAIFGAKTVVAISAPTSLAIQRAEALGVALFAVARQDGVTQLTARCKDQRERAQNERRA
jgi:FdhD protein